MVNFRRVAYGFRNTDTYRLRAPRASGLSATDSFHRVPASDVMGMSWRWWRLGALVPEKLLQSSLKLWDARQGDVPDFIEVDTDVIVDQNVPHAADGLPVQLRQASPSSGRNPLSSLAYDFDVAYDGVLQSLRFQKGFFTRSGEARNAVTALQHVVQVQPVIFHSGVASRRILSRTYQCRDFSVPTWTFTPSNSSRS